MGLLFGQRPCLLLGLLCLRLDCLGSNLRFRCFRFRRHRLNTSFHWLSQPTATFCAASWSSQSPNWLEVVSQSAQSGNGTPKPMSELLYSTAVVLRIIQTSRRRGLQRLGYQAETQDKGRGHIKWPRCECTSLDLTDAEYRGSTLRAYTFGRTCVSVRQYIGVRVGGINLQKSLANRPPVWLALVSPSPPHL
jgi:hypothetical protein